MRLGQNNIIAPVESIFDRRHQHRPCAGGTRYAARPRRRDFWAGITGKTTLALTDHCRSPEEGRHGGIR